MQKELYTQKNIVVADAYDRLEVEIYLKKQQNNLKTLLLCGSEPCVGTTTIAINLAISMANAGWKTLLIDVDIRKDINYKRNNEKNNLGLVNYITEEIDYQKIVCSTNHENLKYIESGFGRNNVVNLLCSVKMQQLLSLLKEEYDIIIIDSTAISSVVDSNIIASYTDGTILITAVNSSKKQLEQAKKQLTHVGANILGIVINRVDKSDYSRYIRDYNYFSGRKYEKRKNIVKKIRRQSRNGKK